VGRDAFVEKFSESDALAIEAAAESHKNGVHDKPGSDPFRWAVLIALGYECMSKDRYRDHHGIAAPWADIEAWLKEPTRREWLAAHDGDSDYLALMVGVYTPYMPEQAPA
jgi:hypothetical protein